MKENGKLEKGKFRTTKKKTIREKLQDRKKRNQRLSMLKKPSFWKLFVKHIIVGLCVAVVIGCVGTKIAVSYYRDVEDREFIISTEGMGDSLVLRYAECMKKGMSPEEALSVWKSAVRWHLNSKTVWGQEACLYDVSTKEMFIEQKCVVNIILIENYGTEDKATHILECEWDVVADAMSDYYNWFQEHEVKDDGSYMGNEPWLEVKELYIKGGTFFPGKMELVINNSSGDTDVLMEYDYTPTGTTGYRYIDLQNNKYKVMGPAWYVKPDENVDCQLIKDYVESGGSFTDAESIWNGNYSEETYTSWGEKTVFSEVIELENGNQYLLVMAADLNLWNQHQGWVIIAYLGLLLLTLLTTIAITYHTYMKRLNYYHLDIYRRETTNAMAHDLKTPLMAISGYAENLRNNVHTEKKDYYADLIMEHVECMNDMVENILELAKVENVAKVSERVLLDLGETTQRILKKYEILNTDKNLWLNVESSCEVEGDKMRMEQALENLISNAIKYAPADSEIYIRLDKDYYEIRNRLDGELDTSVKELWKPFVKGDNSRNEQRGTGVGLTIVKNIADMHGFELVLQYEEGEFVARILF